MHEEWKNIITRAFKKSSKLAFDISSTCMYQYFTTTFVFLFYMTNKYKL